MIVRRRLSGFLLTIVATLLFSGSLRADSVLWTNGAVIGDTRICDSTPKICGGGSDLTIYDNFLVGQSVVTGFTINDYVDDNQETGHTYLGTTWGIWATDPATGSSPIASGTSLAVLTTGLLGSTLFTVTGLDISLSGGEYWLGTGNILDSNTLTTRAFVSTTILSGWEVGYDSSVPQSLPMPNTFGYTNGEFNTAFSIEGVSTPEPATILSMLFALAATSMLRLRTFATGQRTRARH